ncbi:MAG: NUDIX hydrolase [archaeon]
MVGSTYGLFIGELVSVSLNYSIPSHLENLSGDENLRRVDLEKLSGELVLAGSSLEKKKSEGTIWRMGFPGMILDVNHIGQARYGELTVDVSPIHPHRADLAYKGDKSLSRTPVPLTVGAMLLDDEGNEVLAVRGGKVESGKVVSFPGGHVDFENPRVESPVAGLYREFYEEVGMKFDSSNHKASLIGVMNNSDTKGINVLYALKTPSSFKEIEDSWRNAGDRFEHDLLFPATGSDLKNLAKDGKMTRGGRELETTPFFKDVFSRYLDFKSLV